MSPQRQTWGLADGYSTVRLCAEGAGLSETPRCQGFWLGRFQRVRIQMSFARTSSLSSSSSLMISSSSCARLLPARSFAVAMSGLLGRV